MRRLTLKLDELNFSDPEKTRLEMFQVAQEAEEICKGCRAQLRELLPQEHLSTLWDFMDALQVAERATAISYAIRKLGANIVPAMHQSNSSLRGQLKSLQTENRELKAALEKHPVHTVPPAPPEHLLLEVARLRDQVRNLQKQVDALKQEKLTREEFVKDHNVKDLVQRVHELGGFNGQKAKRGPVSTTSTRSTLVPTNETSVQAKARAIEERLKRMGGTATKSDLTASLGTSYFSEALKHLRLSNRVRVNGNQVRLT